MNLYEGILELVEKARQDGTPDLEIQDALSSVNLEITNIIYLKKHYGEDDIPPRLEVRTV